MRRIDSPANPTIKDLARLKKRRERDARGRFLVEGRREVDRAIAAGIDIEGVFHAPELGPAPSWDGDVIGVSEAAFRKLSVRTNPDGVLAVAVAYPTDLGRLTGCDLVLVAEGMEKPGNVGAMLRTADAAGAGVLLASAVADLHNPNVIRASQGSVFTVAVATAPADEARPWLEDRVDLVVATPAGALPHWDVDMTRPTAVVVGAEHTGVSSLWDGAPTVRIPMAGTADSLNASVAAAILLYEAVRQRAVGR